MKKIDSDALGVVTKALGLTGRGAQLTELEDGIVDQTLDVAPLVRRGRTLAGTEGVFVFLFRNVHASANSLTSILNPFQVGDAFAFEPFPTPIPAQFDLWVIGATIFQVSGSGTLSAALHLNFPAVSIGAAITNTGGTPARAVTSHTLAFWDAIATENITFGIKNGSRGPFANIGLRVPRSILSQLIFATTSSAAATFDLRVIVGLFPIGLGQDAIV